MKNKTTVYNFLMLILIIFLLSCNKSINSNLYLIDTGKFGYINKSGEIVINPVYDYAEPFRESLALVKLNDKLFFINTKGEKVISVNYQYVSSFNEGLALFKENNLYGYINQKGEVAIQPTYRIAFPFSDGLARVVIGDSNLYGYINKKNEIIIKSQFNYSDDFYNGLAIIVIDEKYGFINQKGDIIIKPQFQFAQAFILQKNKTVIKLNDKYGYIDNKGNIIIEPQFDIARAFTKDDIARVLIGDKWGYINSKGKIIINPQYDDAKAFHRGKASVLINNKYGFIDDQGKLIIQPQFYYTEGFGDEDQPVDLALVYGEKYGYIDLNGDYVWSYDKQAKITTGTKANKYFEIEDKSKEFKMKDVFNCIFDNFYKPWGISKAELRFCKITETSILQPYNVQVISMDPNNSKFGLIGNDITAGSFFKYNTGKIQLSLISENKTIAETIITVTN